MSIKNIIEQCNYIIENNELMEGRIEDNAYKLSTKANGSTILNISKNNINIVCINCLCQHCLDHTFIKVIDLPETCGTDGYYHMECSNCSYLKPDSSNTIIPMTNNHGLFILDFSKIYLPKYNDVLLKNYPTYENCAQYFTKYNPSGFTNEINKNYYYPPLIYFYGNCQNCKQDYKVYINPFYFYDFSEKNISNNGTKYRYYYMTVSNNTVNMSANTANVPDTNINLYLDNLANYNYNFVFELPDTFYRNYEVRCLTNKLNNLSEVDNIKDSTNYLIDYDQLNITTNTNIPNIYFNSILNNYYFDLLIRNNNMQSYKDYREYAKDVFAQYDPIYFKKYYIFGALNEFNINNYENKYTSNLLLKEYNPQLFFSDSIMGTRTFDSLKCNLYLHTPLNKLNCYDNNDGAHDNDYGIKYKVSYHWFDCQYDEERNYIYDKSGNYIFIDKGIVENPEQQVLGFYTDNSYDNYDEEGNYINTVYDENYCFPIIEIKIPKKYYNCKFTTDYFQCFYRFKYSSSSYGAQYNYRIDSINDDVNNIIIKFIINCSPYRISRFVMRELQSITTLNMPFKIFNDNGESAVFNIPFNFPILNYSNFTYDIDTSIAAQYYWMFDEKENKFVRRCFNHSYEQIFDIEPTCLKGKCHYLCTDCGYIDETRIDEPVRPEHDHDEIILDQSKFYCEKCNGIWNHYPNYSEHPNCYVNLNEDGHLDEYEYLYDNNGNAIYDEDNNHKYILHHNDVYESPVIYVKGKCKKCNTEFNYYIACTNLPIISNDTIYSGFTNDDPVYYYNRIYSYSRDNSDYIKWEYETNYKSSIQQTHILYLDQLAENNYYFSLYINNYNLLRFYRFDYYDHDFYDESYIRQIKDIYEYDGYHLAENRSDYEQEEGDDTLTLDELKDKYNLYWNEYIDYEKLNIRTSVSGSNISAVFGSLTEDVYLNLNKDNTHDDYVNYLRDNKYDYTINGQILNYRYNNYEDLYSDKLETINLTTTYNDNMMPNNDRIFGKSNNGKINLYIHTPVSQCKYNYSSTPVYYNNSNNQITNSSYNYLWYWSNYHAKTVKLNYFIPKKYRSLKIMPSSKISISNSNGLIYYVNMNVSDVVIEDDYIKIKISINASIDSNCKNYNDGTRTSVRVPLFFKYGNEYEYIDLSVRVAAGSRVRSYSNSFTYEWTYNEETQLFEKVAIEEG